MTYTCLPVRWGAGARVIKYCEPFVFGPLFAITSNLYPPRSASASHSYVILSLFSSLSRFIPSKVKPDSPLLINVAPLSIQSLILKRCPKDTLPARSSLLGKISTLDHKPFDDTVDDGVFVVKGNGGDGGNALFAGAKSSETE